MTDADGGVTFYRMNCHACGAELSAGARYCPKCGAKVSAARAADWRAGLPWGVAGAAVGALIAVVLLRQTGRPDSAGSVGGPVAPFAGGGGPAQIGGRPPDISQMSPEERATRLYNRVMTLHAAGKPDSAEFFLPMALQAYEMLPKLDADSRYHVGVLELTSGALPAALAQADSIQRTNPTHLFSFMLRARALELQRDTSGARRAYREFLRNEAAERARKRPEYADHAQNLDEFHSQALEATSGKGKPTS